jgi:VanZ family protein
VIQKRGRSSAAISTQLPAGRSKLPTVLWVASAVFIVYGTTIPFHFVSEWRVALEHLARVRLNPLITPETGGPVSISDFVSNILLFVPFGCFGVWSLRRPRAIVPRVAVIVMLSVVLSTTVETLQLFTIDRISSVADVFANGLGGLTGAVGAVFVQTSGEALLGMVTETGVTEVAAFYPFLVATLVVCVGTWEPFDVTLDVGSVFSKIHTFLRDPWQAGPPSDEVVSFLQHLLFTSLLVVWLQEVRVRSAAAIAAVVGTVVGLGAEASQLFIAGRMPGLSDAVVAVAGALTGVPTGLMFQKRAAPAFWCTLLFAVTALGVAMQQLSPFKAANEPQPFQWMPFLSYYLATTGNTVSHAAELLVSYFPLGFGLAMWVRNRRARLAAVLSAALVIAVPVEYLQRFIAGRYADVTDIGLSVAGAWLGSWTATEGWRLFDGQLELISRRR